MLTREAYHTSSGPAYLMGLPYAYSPTPTSLSFPCICIFLCLEYPHFCLGLSLAEMTPPHEVFQIDSSGSSLRISRCCPNGRGLWLPAPSSLSPQSSIHSLVVVVRSGCCISSRGWNKHAANACTATQSNIFSPPGMSGSSKELCNYLEQTRWSCCPWWPSSRGRLDDISVCDENCLPRRAALGE